MGIHAEIWRLTRYESILGPISWHWLARPTPSLTHKSSNTSRQFGPNWLQIHKLKLEKCIQLWENDEQKDKFRLSPLVGMCQWSSQGYRNHSIRSNTETQICKLKSGKGWSVLERWRLWRRSSFRGSAVFSTISALLILIQSHPPCNPPTSITLTH